jgi:hypothetical protein
MGLHWEPQDHWIRTEVDAMLQDFGANGVARFADEFERICTCYVGDSDIAAALVAELRRRAAAGVRYRLGPRPIEESPLIWGPKGRLTIGSLESLPLEDDEIPW